MTSLAERGTKAFVAKLQELCPDMDGWDAATDEDKILATACIEAALTECKVEAIVDALRWYGSQKPYETEGLPGDTVYDRMRRKERILEDRGARARDVLARLEVKMASDGPNVVSPEGVEP